MSIPRILNIVALILFIVFVATFFTVLVRVSRTGFLTDRFVTISTQPLEGEPPVGTWFDLLGQEQDTGRLRFHIRSRLDTASEEFKYLKPGDPIVLRIQNLQPELRRNYDLQTEFQNPTFGQFVILDFGEYYLEVPDKRDFYPFDGYDLSFSFAYHVTGNEDLPTGKWVTPQQAVMKSLTNLIFMNPRYVMVLPDTGGFRVRVSRLRMLQFLTATLILIELLFLVYLITLVDLQKVLSMGLGYMVGLFIVREVLVAGAPQFPTLIDYGTLFLICVTFFLMLFKFLGGAEEHTLITLPPAWRIAFMPGNDIADDKEEEEDKDEKDIVPISITKEEE